ncbi:hypothetical protein J3B02_003835, partial [Coemansia erecta]
MSQSKDEGFDDYPPYTTVLSASTGSFISTMPFSALREMSLKQTTASTGPDKIFSKVAIVDTEKKAMDSLALLLKTSADPHACTHLAIMLLSHVPADMLKLVMQQLDLLLRRDFIGALPIEISTQILEYLTAEDIAQSVSLVNRRWHAIATQPCLWRRLYHRRGWKVDRQRWEFYYALPRNITPAKMLLDSAVFQVSRALAITANLTVAPSSLQAVSMAISNSVAAAAAAAAAATTTTATATATEVEPAETVGTVARKEAKIAKISYQQPGAYVGSLQTALLDTSDHHPGQVINGLSAATLRAMLLDGDRQAARKPRKMLYSLMDLQRQAIRDRASSLATAYHVESSDATSQKSFYQQMLQRQHCQQTQKLSFKTPVVSKVNLKNLSSFSQSLQTSRHTSDDKSHGASARQLKHPWAPKPVDWQLLYSEYHCLLKNWRNGQCRVDRWESAHQESIYTLQFDQKNRLFTGSRDNSVKVWHLSETGSQLTPLATLRGHTGSVLTLHAEDNLLVTGSSDSDVCVWSTDTYTVRQRLTHPDAVLSLRFNDKWLATACKDGVVRVWRRKQQTFVDPFELNGHAVAINAIDLHEDTLVSASGDRTIRVWDLVARSCTMTLAGHARGVACVDFDGTHIVSGSSDRSIRIWGIATGQCERTISNAHSDLVRTV